MSLSIATHVFAFAAGVITAVLYSYHRLMSEIPKELEERYGEEVAKAIWENTDANLEVDA